MMIFAVTTLLALIAAAPTSPAAVAPGHPHSSASDFQRLAFDWHELGIKGDAKYKD